MGWIEILLIGVGLSMDAFAVAICKGLAMPKVNKSHALVIALFFGGFQALMPLAGYLLGSAFADSINAFDHWIVFILLSAIGGKMVFEAIRGDGGDAQPNKCRGLDLKELTLMSVATSIDALAVGISFAFLKVNIAQAGALIGCTTFAIAFAGVFVGNFFGARYKNESELVGGAILILIGLKILLEHLGVVAL